jgi:hypothetical protein
VLAIKWVITPWLISERAAAKESLHKTLEDKSFKPDQSITFFYAA